MFSVVTRKGFEKAILSGVVKAKMWAYRYYLRTGKPVRVINIVSGEAVAEFPQS